MLMVMAIMSIVSMGCVGERDDYSLVEQYKQVSSVAEQGDAEAQFNLGQMYLEGKAVPQDYEQTVYWYRLAAEQGYTRAQNNLGLMYYNGLGVPQNLEQAEHWYRLARE